MIQVTRDMQTTPAINIVNTALRGEHDRQAQKLQVRLTWFHSDVSDACEEAGVNLVKYHKSHLGKQDYCVNLEFRMWVWDREGYRLYVSNQKGICFEVPPTASVEDVSTALGDYLWDVACSDRLISRQEETELVEKGRELLRGKEMQCPRMNDEDLRKFVYDYVSGRVWTDQMTPPELVGSVFMPLFFGGFRPDDEMWALLDDPESGLPSDPGDAPEVPDPPEAPEAPPKPERPEKPPQPEPLKPDPKRVSQIQSDIDWEQSGEETLAAYLKDVEAQNEALRAEYEKTLGAHQAAWEKVQENYSNARALYKDELRAHKQALAEHEDHVRGHALLKRQWDIAKARRGAVVEGFLKQWLANIGILYEYMSQAGPRSINGCPMFFSVRYMHREDWCRARGAIQREEERRQNITL